MGGILEDVARLLEAWHLPPDPDVRKFRVSDAGKCLRMRYLKRKEPQGSQNAGGTNGRQMMGTLFHEWLEAEIGRELGGGLVGTEIPVEDEHRIGHIDMLIVRDGELVVVDIKTVTHTLASRLVASPPVPYLYQAATYASMVGANSAEILFLDKDTLERIPVPVPGECWVQAGQDWDRLSQLWVSGTVPDMTENQSECKYCPWSNGCH
jgi:CRISPR/Cas system-associated exonuclease Cas4 (RecB family)